MAEKYALTKGACDALARLLRADMVVGSRQSGGPGAISPDAYPLPFSVRWSASADSGSGAWVIWLPNLAQLVHYGSSAISTISGVTAAAELPAGWYTVDALQASSVALYLVVSVVAATGVVTAALSDQAGTASTGQTVYNLLVASMATNATTGMKSVKQYLASTVTLGGAGGGGSITADGIVVMSVDYVMSSGDPDFASHAYAIRITRGRQSYNAATRQLTTVEDNNLKQFIDTVPHTSST